MSDLPASVRLVKKSALIDLLQIDNEFTKATVSLWGAHILSFTPKHDSRERLFLSERALFDGSESIRGGVPICWPWFGSRQDGLQAHGYICTRDWTLLSAKDESEYTEIVLAPLSTDGPGFDGHADLQLAIRMGRKMRITLSTTNTGDNAFEYNAALHSYFAVDDIAQTKLGGMSGIYADHVRDWARFDTPSPYLFFEETDRIHLNPVEQLSIQQGGCSTEIESFGHDSLVVWNPWSEIATNLVDMADTEYQKMLCVETAVTQGVTVEPGQTHTLEQLIS